MKHEKGSSAKLYVIALILFVLITLLAIGGATGGMTGSPNSNVEGAKSYNSIDDLIRHTEFSMYIPNEIYNYNGKVINTQSLMGQVIEVDTEDFIFKASSPIVSYNADILGLYDYTKDDYMFFVDSESNPIKFIRYRLNYPSYEHCTIIDWCTDETTHGLIMGSIMSENDVLALFGIDKVSLTETNQSEIVKLENGESTLSDNDIDVSNIEYDTYTIGDMFTVDIPKFTSGVNVLDENGVAKFYVDKKLVFVIIYNDYDIETDAFSGQSEKVLADGIVLKYKSENPFDQGHVDYENYNRFIKTIDNIKETIVFK